MISSYLGKQGKVRVRVGSARGSCCASLLKVLSQEKVEWQQAHVGGATSNGTHAGGSLQFGCIAAFTDCMITELIRMRNVCSGRGRRGKEEMGG